jgi:hypothetical protein
MPDAAAQLANVTETVDIQNGARGAGLDPGSPIPDPDKHQARTDKPQARTDKPQVRTDKDQVRYNSSA